MTVELDQQFSDKDKIIFDLGRLCIGSPAQLLSHNNYDQYWIHIYFKRIIGENPHKYKHSKTSSRHPAKYSSKLGVHIELFGEKVDLTDVVRRGASVYAIKRKP